MKDYYKIFEIEPTATFEQIKSQHRFLLHAWHPDKFPNVELKAKAEEKVREINEAYRILSDPIERKIYDRALHNSSSPAQPSYSQQVQNPPHAQTKEYCQSCGLPVETKYIEFYENVGMIIMRQHRSVKGNFCKSCIDYYFWNLTGKTMLLGWWGTISLIVTPFILLNNFFSFRFYNGHEKASFVSNSKPLTVLGFHGNWRVFINRLLFLFNVFCRICATNILTISHR